MPKKTITIPVNRMTPGVNDTKEARKKASPPKLGTAETNPTTGKHFKKVPIHVPKKTTIYSIPPADHNKLGQSKKPLFSFPKTKDLKRRKTNPGQNILGQAIGQTKVV